MQETYQILKLQNCVFDVFCFLRVFVLGEEQTIGETGVFPTVCLSLPICLALVLHIAPATFFVTLMNAPSDWGGGATTPPLNM